MVEQDRLRKDIYDSSSKLKRGLYTIFPALLDKRTTRKTTVQLEKKRREELGTEGRILEDARNAVLACTTRSMWLNKIERRKKGEFEPIPKHTPDSYTSYSRTTTKYLTEKGLDQKNVLGNLRGVRFSFAMGIDINGHFTVEEDTPDVFLVGTTEDGKKILQAHKLGKPYFESLSPRDFLILEVVASDIYRESRNQVFSDFMDSKI